MEIYTTPMDIFRKRGFVLKNLCVLKMGHVKGVILQTFKITHMVFRTQFVMFLCRNFIRRLVLDERSKSYDPCFL